MCLHVQTSSEIIIEPMWQLLPSSPTACMCTLIHHSSIHPSLQIPNIVEITVTVRPGFMQMCYQHKVKICEQTRSKWWCTIDWWCGRLNNKDILGLTSWLRSCVEYLALSHLLFTKLSLPSLFSSGQSPTAATAARTVALITVALW